MITSDLLNIASLDAMGGDNGPEAVVEGANAALLVRPELKFIFHGDEQRIRSIINKYPALKDISTVQHSDVVIEMDEKPSVALRRGKGTSSMWMATESVKNQEAGFTLSCGNTGALMATSMFCLGRMKGFERPAIAAIWPSQRAECIVLDVGATVGADADQLKDFAVLGAAMATAIYDIKCPTIGLLNVGVEEVKGIEEVKKAAELIRRLDKTLLNYHGFVEGHDISKGTTDVIVTEGFSGNIALKTAEGTAMQINTYLKAVISDSLSSKLGALFASRAFRTLSDKMSPNNNNGGVFLGLNGIVIKSHGNANAKGIASAIQLGHDLSRNGMMQNLIDASEKFEPIKSDDEALADVDDNKVKAK